jgi:hypothetical protein
MGIYLDPDQKLCFESSTLQQNLIQELAHLPAHLVLVVPDPGSDNNSDNGGTEATEERGCSRKKDASSGVGSGGVGSGGVGSGGVGSGGVGSGGAGSGGVGSGGATLNAILVGVEHLSAKAGHSTVVPELLQTVRILVLHVGPALLPHPAGLLYVGEGRGVEDTSLPATNIRRTLEVASSLAKSFAAGEAFKKNFHSSLFILRVDRARVHSFLYTGIVVYMVTPYYTVLRIRIRDPGLGAF